MRLYTMLFPVVNDYIQATAFTAGHTRGGMKARKGSAMMMRLFIGSLWVIGIVVGTGCDRDSPSADAQPTAKRPPINEPVPELVQPLNEPVPEVVEPPATDFSRYGPYAEAFAHAEKVRQDRRRGIAPEPVILPNHLAGPGNPRPERRNFYEIYDHYPGYLLCTYGIREARYNPNKEADHFEAAIKQIRDLGPQKFPAVGVIAVIIQNRAEHKGVNTFVESHKVGCIFSAGDVFDRSVSSSQLVAQAAMDHKPFAYDPQHDAQRAQRWLIVERHMKGTRSDAESK